MNILDMIGEQADIEVGTKGVDTEHNRQVTFVEWADADMVVVETDRLQRYTTYVEEIEWEA